MKKIIFIFTIAFILFSSCTVNKFTGLIKVENKTSVILKNVKIGDTTIVSFVNPGDTYCYWYADTIKGKMSAEGVIILEGQQNENFTLEVNYWVYITAARYSTGPNTSEPYLILTKEKNGK